MRKFLRLAIILTCFFSAGKLFAAGGACPASSPLAGNNTCFFIAANGSDGNSGTSETAPWLHAPGMPSCSGACLSEQNALGGGDTVNAGIGLIFRGGDTWHEGNSGASPYTGGTFNIIWSGSSSACAYEGTQTGCFYVGVDQSWQNTAICGSNWCRPVLTGDNPTSTSPVSACGYQVGSANQLFIASNNENQYVYLDGFELTGMCFKDTTPPSVDNEYIVDEGSGIGGSGMIFYNNLYIHGWTITTGTAANSAIPCTLLGGGANGLNSITSLVVDGSDSLPGGCAWAAYPSFYHFKDSIVRYATDGVGQWCHDIHDVTLTHWFPPYYGETSPAHGNWTNHPNTLECNADSSGNAPNQPANTPNVFYNNNISHDDSSQANAGAVHIWFCPTTIPEYWFNNLMYDIVPGNQWDYSGGPTYSCPSAGSGSGPVQYMFNNTLVDVTQPCYNAAYNFTSHNPLTIANEHLINSGIDSSTGNFANPPCRGYNSPTNIAMSDATATSQGYTTGSSGTAGTGNTCANDAAKPCAPTCQQQRDRGHGNGRKHVLHDAGEFHE